MAMAGLYRRILPSPPAIDFASSEGKTQSEPAYCGLASLAMVLNALSIDPGRKWKGSTSWLNLGGLSCIAEVYVLLLLIAFDVDCSCSFMSRRFILGSWPWRWFDESMLDCCEPLEKVKATGISFGKLVCLAHCAGAKVEAFRTNQSTINDFRKYIMACSTSDNCHVISSYHRGTFKQTGTGHFSPIGGYHAGKDMALILDVARFKYPPHWVPLKLLWEAMNTVDEASGRPRGYVLIQLNLILVSLFIGLSFFFWQSCKHESWVSIAKFLVDDVPCLLKSEDVKDIRNVLSVILSSLPTHFREFIKWVAEVRTREEDGSQSLSQEEKERLAIKEEVLKQVQEISLYKHVTEFLSSEKSCCKTILGTENEENFPEIAAHVCCQGAGLLSGISGSSQQFCCQATCVKCFKVNGDKPVTVVSGTVVNGSGQQGVEVLVPSSQSELSCWGCGPSNYVGMYPASNDILTALLLALPPETWSGIKEEKLLQEVHGLVSTENLPTLLQEEVLHLRGQLQLLKRCKDNKVEEDLGAPLF
ncbi:hypothetical protein RHGRI_035872 [Rhododendron griersonianum]|uniref:glutathione gamma-glutamylcysteinyltransferase n=1 Tax=Rhododendron griersonianum TaxID=479676 RepID=A0AAV6HR75_9ERIC|nr:hypothetical protein RHGRI_035872 [Rhododendron griersonianum]